MRNVLVAAGIALLALSPLSPAFHQTALAEYTGAPEPGQPMILPVDPAPLVVETAEGARSFTIEVADNDEERSRGLMFRMEMADDHGMLFVFEQTRRVGFWMKNTPMALDLIFVGDDGRIRDIMPGEPFSTDSIAPQAEVRFVLELKAGTARREGLAAGDRVRHTRIDEVAGQG